MARRAAGEETGYSPPTMARSKMTPVFAAEKSLLRTGVFEESGVKSSKQSSMGVSYL